MLSTITNERRDDFKFHPCWIGVVFPLPRLWLLIANTDSLL